MRTCGHEGGVNLPDGSCPYCAPQWPPGTAIREEAPPTTPELLDEAIALLQLIRARILRK